MVKCKERILQTRSSAQNAEPTFSLLSLTGIIAIAGVYTYKKRKKQPE
ncbi:DUF4293 domain-containing protein [Candidatus Bathyarchaeota archaeon]|nr:DUF4293 domain-containing protein [Candidatus Bathyarchaeota archaeon]